MVEIGHFALVLAFALALVQSVLPLAGARSGNARMMATGEPVGLLAISSYLQRKGVDVSIYDCFVEGDKFDGDEADALCVWDWGVHHVLKEATKLELFGGE